MGEVMRHIFLLSHKYTKKKKKLKKIAEGNNFHQLFCSINLASRDQYCFFFFFLNIPFRIHSL